MIDWDRAQPYKRQASQAMRRALIFLSHNRSALCDGAVQDALVALSNLCASGEVRTLTPRRIQIRRAKTADYDAAVRKWIDAIAAWRERVGLDRHEAAASPALRLRLLNAIASHHSGNVIEGERIASAVLDALLNPQEGT